MDIDRIGDDVVEAASYVKRDDEFGLPARLVEQHRWLATRSDKQLQHLLVAVAVHLAARRDGQRPRSVLEAAIDAIQFGDWEAVKAKIRRVSQGIEPSTEDEPDESHG
jgi:hypothetical protein